MSNGGKKFKKHYQLLLIIFSHFVFDSFGVVNYGERPNFTKPLFDSQSIDCEWLTLIQQRECKQMPWPVLPLAP